MQISLPDDADALIRSKAAAAGFGDRIGEYVVSLIAADQPAVGRALSDAELQESVAMMRASEEDIVAGRTQDMREALVEAGRKRALALDE